MMDYTVAIQFGKNSGMQYSKVTICLHQTNLKCINCIDTLVTRNKRKSSRGRLNLDEITPDQLFEHLDEECKPGGSAYRSRSDLWHNTKQGNMTPDDFYNKIERLCDLCSFSPKEHKAFHRDAFLFNLSNQGTTQ